LVMDLVESGCPAARDIDAETGSGERLPHLLRNYYRIVIDEQQVGHDGSLLKRPGKASQLIVSLTARPV